ncbi:MAG: outer membrane beta-barrel protein [Helicobacteraceae bacterium]|nr:outer membrane beta-barrel protein [Candidatus Sulfurimonas ponti]
MRKNIAIALLLLNTAVFGAAKETKMLPIFTEGYCATPTIALMGGYGKYSEASNGASMYGLELGFACPVFQIKDLEINQVLSLVHSDKDGLETNTLEMNPRIMFKLNDKTKFGFGPGLGVIFAKSAVKSDSVFGFNVGASLNYDITSDMFIGIESRYQWAKDAELSNGAKTNMNNSRTLIKIGTHF